MLRTTNREKSDKCHQNSFCFIAHPVETWNWMLYSGGALNHKLPEKRPYPYLFPFDMAVSLYFLIGRKSFDRIDEYSFNGTLKGQTYLIRNFGWHFMLNSWREKIRRRILETVLHAQKSVNVIGLGALTKAEWLTKGGQWIVDELGSRLKVPVVHGDTMTAATVIRQARELMRCHQIDTPVLMTGATSKIGRAVILALAADGYDMVMFTESKERFEAIQAEAGSAGRHIRWSADLKAGKDCRLWITGKAVPAGKNLLNRIPQGAFVLNFSVPNPLVKRTLRTRPDVVSVEGGLLAYDPALTDLKVTMRLQPGLTYACHAGTMVHAYEGWKHHEVGKVELSQMDDVWESAKRLGFYLPSVT